MREIVPTSDSMVPFQVSEREWRTFENDEPKRGQISWPHFPPLSGLGPM